MIVSKISIIDNNSACQLREIFVENTDLIRIDQTANQGVNGKNALQMQNIAGYYEGLETRQIVECDIDTLDVNSLTVTVEDAGNSIYDFSVSVALILEEEEPLSYEEAYSKANLEKKALEITNK